MAADLSSGKSNMWEPDNPHQHWPDRAEVKSAVERAREPDAYVGCGGIAKDIDIIGRSLRFRRWDLMRARLGYSKLDAGHPERFDIERELLKKLMDKADRKQCEFNVSALYESEFSDEDENGLPGPEDVKELFNDW